MYADGLLLLGSCVLSGVYSGSEAALVSIPVDRTRQLIDEGGKKGKALEFLAKNQNLVLTTILVGNNIVNIFAASYATALAEVYFTDNAIAITVGVMTFLILVFGEIVPKTFARTHAEKLAYPIIQFLRVNYLFMFPLISFLTWFIHKLLGENAKLTGRTVTKDDIEFMVSKAEKERSMDSKQIDMLNSILEFPMIKVKDIMVTRQRVVAVKYDDPFDRIIEIVKEDAHSRYPVYQDDLDTTIGFLHVKDMAFVKDKERANFDIRKYIKPPFFVYEHMKVQAVFDHMNRKKVHLALVKDENGLVVGIITLEDIMEEIFGEITDEHDDEDDVEESNVREFEDEGLVVEAAISLRELYNDYDIKIPLNDNFSTLRGFLLDMLGNNFPHQGNIIVWEGFSFELIEVDNFEIRQVRIRDVDGEKHIIPKDDQEVQEEIS